MLEPTKAYAYKLPPLRWTEPGQYNEFKNEKDFSWVLPKDFIEQTNDEKRFGGILETIHGYRDKSNYNDTIKLTFNNGKRTIQSPKFGKSSRNSDDVEIGQGMSLISVQGGKGFETVTLKTVSHKN